MSRLPPGSTLVRSSAASDVYKRQGAVTRFSSTLVSSGRLQSLSRPQAGPGSTRSSAGELLHLARVARRSSSLCRSGSAGSHVRQPTNLAGAPGVGTRLSLIHISEPHETVLDLVCRLLLEQTKKQRLGTRGGIIKPQYRHVSREQLTTQRSQMPSHIPSSLHCYHT